MGKHSKRTVPRVAPYLSTGLALPAAAMFAFAYAAGGHVLPNGLLAADTTIFIDGTKSLTGQDDGASPGRMADSLGGRYDQGPDGDVFVDYPRSLGAATGAGDPTYDVSEGVATTEIVAAVKAAQQNRRPGETIYVVGYSQGAGAAAQAITQLEADGHADGTDYTDGVQFVLAANPRRNDGGILTRVPAGTYLPVLGVTFGDGTTPQTTNVLQVTKQYDGVGDAPVYVLNVVADVNAAMGYYYLHPGYYRTVDPSPVPADDRIVSTSADGRITDVLVKAPVGELPLTMPLLQAGVPKPFVDALDPFLRAVIETGYDRPSGAGTFPSQPVPFQLAPPPAAWVSDVRSVATGAVQTTTALTGATPKAVGTVAAPAAVTASVAASDPPTAKVPAVSHRAVTPPHPTTGAWKPGDLLRSVFGTKPSTTPATGGTPSATQAPATAGTGTASESHTAATP